MTTPLPTNIGTGLVTGRFGVVGSADGGVAPLTEMTVTFTAMPQGVLDVTATPGPIALAMRPVVCSINADGQLCGPGGVVGVVLVATDDTDLNPVDWTYRVEFTVGRQRAAFLPLNLSVPTGAVVDLVSAITGVATAGTWTVSTMDYVIDGGTA